MCTINCSGGCYECAPDEHEFRAWWEEIGKTIPQDKYFLQNVFAGGWYARDKPRCEEGS